ncbi:MAG: glycosyltransferase [Candidatus Didemnitutus sp.]|nr:glycosyltransferase [Candidatus Didemnitutus sp.]
MPLVSVVMPARNAAATVARAVASIQGQTFRDWELVALDDGSKDATRFILIEMAQIDPRIRVLRTKSGIAGALNAGIAAAAGEFIARMDADDEMLPERLAKQVAFLQANPDVGVVGSCVEFGGDPVKAAGYALHVEWVNSLLTSEEITLNRFVESPFAHPSVMFRRHLVDDHGNYRDGDFPEDYELWLRWMDVNVKMAKLPDTLLTWHDLPDRASRTDPRYAPEAFYKLKAFWLAEWLKREIEPPRTVWIWGAGRPTRQRAAHLAEHGVKIAGYIDIDAKKTGKKVGGVPVIAPADLPPREQNFVLGYVGTRGARDYIRTQLTATGRHEGRDFLMCA